MTQNFYSFSQEFSQIEIKERKKIPLPSFFRIPRGPSPPFPQPKYLRTYNENGHNSNKLSFGLGEGTPQSASGWMASAVSQPTHCPRINDCTDVSASTLSLRYHRRQGLRARWCVSTAGQGLAYTGCLMRSDVSHCNSGA